MKRKQPNQHMCVELLPFSAILFADGSWPLLKTLVLVKAKSGQRSRWGLEAEARGWRLEVEVEPSGRGRGERLEVEVRGGSYRPDAEGRETG